MKKDIILLFNINSIMKYLNRSGIYIFRNITNNRFFIGSSNKFSDIIYILHKQLNSNSFYNDCMQNDYNLNNKFEFDIIELCDINKIQERKKYYMDIFSLNNNTYNSLEDYDIKPEIYFVSRKTESKLKGMQRSDDFKNAVKIGLKKYFDSHKERSRAKWTQERRDKMITERGLKQLVNRKHTPYDIVKKIKDDLNEKIDDKEIALKYDVPIYIVRNIKYNRSFKYIH